MQQKYFSTAVFCCKDQKICIGCTGGDDMKKQVCIRLDPEERLCPAYDSCSIKIFSAPVREEMGIAVLDNFPEEHIQ